MNKRIVFVLGALLLVGAGLFIAWQLALPTRVSNADAETFARANQAYEKGNNQAAANLYQQLISNGVENAEVFYNLGVTFTAMGNANQAEEMYARARELNPRATQIAQTANAARIPLTQNEMALLALAAIGVCAVVFVLMRPRILKT